jgi:hypothetical protein
MYFLGNASLLYQTSKEKFGGIKGVISTNSGAGTVYPS